MLKSLEPLYVLNSAFSFDKSVILSVPITEFAAPPSLELPAYSVGTIILTALFIEDNLDNNVNKLIEYINKQCQIL